MMLVPGMEVSTGPTGRRIIFTGELPEFSAALEEMMALNVEFAFYDPMYPSPSDPGAYFSYSPSRGAWRMTLGNHGWSGGIYTIAHATIGTQLRSLYSRKLLKALDLDNVHFSAHYAPESPTKSEEMNVRLQKLHAQEI